MDYKTPSGSCETLRFCDSFLSVGGSVENCERITQTLRNELNPKPSGTIVDFEFTQDEYFMTRDLRDAYRDPTLRSPMTPGISPMVARYRSASVEAMIAIDAGRP